MLGTNNKVEPIKKKKKKKKNNNNNNNNKVENPE